MNVWKKIGALTFVLIVAMALSVSAFATSTTLGANGEQGAFTTPDTPTTQSKTLILNKELKVYNKDETTINAPTISYTYTIAAATVADGTTVTDKVAAHNGDNVTVQAPVYAGEGEPTVSGPVAWATTETVTAADEGASNIKTFSIDFSSIAFTKAGVYRYAVTEALTTAGDSYAMSGVTETSGNHIRYVDVYVRANPSMAAGTEKTSADYWDIYGFTCFYNNATFTDDNKTTAAVKSTGFVAGTTDGSTALTADSYYTFNVALSKTVVNDPDAQANHQFPFAIIFTNSNVTKNVDIIANATGTVTVTNFDPDASPLKSGEDASNIKGVPTILSGGNVKYVGIPCGTSVEVYETNDVTGVTYKVETSTDGGTAVTDNSVISGTAPTTANVTAQGATKAVYQSTKATITTAADADDDTAHSVAITNTLLNISPTGVTLRYAPYFLTLGAGVVALPLTRSYRRREED